MGYMCVFSHCYIGDDDDGGGGDASDNGGDGNGRWEKGIHWAA
jgi:hypothetical protein